jgi:hypothetical protein
MFKPFRHLIPLGISVATCYGPVSDAALAVQLNPYFAKADIKRPVPPVFKQIKSQLAQGCAPPDARLRPLGDNYALRHKIKLPVSKKFRQTTAAIAVGDISFQQAQSWMAPFLTGTNEAETIMAHLLLASHSIRKIADGHHINPDSLLRSAKSLATRTGMNLSDFLFLQSLTSFKAKDYKSATTHITAAIKADPVFYNARLLKLDIELKKFGQSRSRSRRKCITAMQTILQTTVNLGQLDTCPRHAILMNEWIRSKYANPDKSLPVQIISAYVSLLANNKAQLKTIQLQLANRDFQQSPACQAFVLQRVQQLEALK